MRSISTCSIGVASGCVRASSSTRARIPPFACEREGYELTGTKNHPVLTLQSVAGVPLLVWKLLHEMVPGDRAALLRTSAIADTKALTPRERALATLAGGMVSEGWASEGRAGCNNLDESYFVAVTDAYDDIVGRLHYA